jgi:regulator of protease activity HflC (stomatin/prohibitin superfamily)
MNPSWIIQLLEWAYQFWPTRIVHSYQQGVRFRNGQDISLLRTGFYVFIPVIESIELVVTAQDVEWTGVQSLMLMDGTEVTIDGKLLYRVRNARMYFVNVTEFKTSLSGICEIHLARAVRKLANLAELLEKQEEIETELKGVLSKAAFDWGVDVKDYGFANLTTAKASRMFGIQLGARTE